MTDRKKKHSDRSSQSQSSTRSGSQPDGGFGDDQGTRIGEPTPPQRAQEPPAREYRGPSSTPVKEGIEGAIFDEDDESGPAKPHGPERHDTT